MISREDVKKIATLARITVSDTEADTYAGDAEEILSFVVQVGGTSSPHEGDAHMLLTNVMREDGVPHEEAAYTKDILDNAPKTENDYIVVRKVITKE